MRKEIFIITIIIIICIIFNNWKSKNKELKLKCVITACNENPLYMTSIPIFIDSWKILYPDVDVKIILIIDKIPNDYMVYKDNIIVFKPIKNVSTALTSQYIRLLYPCLLNYDNGVMITDIDDIPMNKTFFKDNLKGISNNKFVYYRDWKENNEIAMCWQIATPKTWRSVFNINGIDDINNRIIEVSRNNKYIEGHGNIGWNTDQKELYKYINKWNNKTNDFLMLKDKNTGYNRIDRNDKCGLDIDENVKLDIINGKYSDYHICRPYEKYKKYNDEILYLLRKQK